MNQAPTSIRRRNLLVGVIALPAAGCATQTGMSTPQSTPATMKPTPPAAAEKPAAAATPAGRALPAYTDWKDADALIVHSPNTIETKRAAFGTSVITPTDLLFVRNNINPPDASIVADPLAWMVAVDGVRKPRQLTVRELQALGIETVAMVLQCSGNGRAFFPHKPSGTQWKVGAAGCVLWSGVPVRTLVDALGGVADGMRYMTGTGGETLPANVDPKTLIVERSLPLAAMADALLAWELNGAPIPLAHGGPLRLIVPGFTGVNNVKYLKRLAFTPTESDARIMATRYRMAPLGGKGSPSQPSVQEMSVKSWINSPDPEHSNLRAGVVQIHGVALGGVRAVKGVEVSTDGGKTWRAAQFIGPDLGKYAWRQFVQPVRLAPGRYVLASRATDAAGSVQPQERPENASGYNNNGWADHAVTVTVS